MGDNDEDARISTVWETVQKQCTSSIDNAVNTKFAEDGTESTGWNIVRVFVSSTFTDFHSEREVLVKQVYFPI